MFSEMKEGDAPAVKDDRAGEMQRKNWVLPHCGDKKKNKQEKLGPMEGD